MRAELFYLKQFGFSESTLEYIYINNKNPIRTLFDKTSVHNIDINSKLTPKEKDLIQNYEGFIKFKKSLYEEEFVYDNKINKIYFK